MGLKILTHTIYLYTIRQLRIRYETKFNILIKIIFKKMLYIDYRGMTADKINGNRAV